jgi:hypothetical protein
MKAQPFLCYFTALVLIGGPVWGLAFQQQSGNRQVDQKKNQEDKKQKQDQKPPVKKETTAQWLLRFLGISATPSAMKGEDDKIAGDIWLANLDTRASQSITRDGGYRSPIILAGNSKVLALKGDEVIEIEIESHEIKKLYTVKGIVKLVGVNTGDSNQVLFLRQDQQQGDSVGALSLKDGRVEARELDANSDDDRRMLAHLRGWERVFDGGKAIVYTKIETKEGLAGAVEWSDVYLKREGHQTINVSNCDGVDCGQPSMSANGQLVVYLKSSH